MFSETVKKLTKIMFTGMTMVICAAVFVPGTQAEAATLQEAEPNDNPAEANQLPLNMLVTGVSRDREDDDWYQFTIPQAGVAQVELSKGIEETESRKWDMKLEDSDRHSLSEVNGIGTVGKTYQMGLAPGKYYIKIGLWGGYGSNAAYNLKVNYTKTDSWEEEQYYENKTIANANTVYLNIEYTGTMYCVNDVDWYRFKLNGNNKLSLRFRIDDTVSNPQQWYIQFIEYKTRKVLKETSLRTNENITVDNCSGDLIVKVSTSYAWNAAGDIYHIQLTSKNAQTLRPASTTPAVQKPAATRITSIKAGKRKATVRWKKSANATGYYVYRATSPNGKYKRVATVTGKTSYVDRKSLKSKKKYYYKVTAIRKSGSKVLKSKASAYRKVKIK